MPHRPAPLLCRAWFFPTFPPWYFSMRCFSNIATLKRRRSRDDHCPVNFFFGVLSCFSCFPKHFKGVWRLTKMHALPEKSSLRHEQQCSCNHACPVGKFIGHAPAVRSDHCGIVGNSPLRSFRFSLSAYPNPALSSF